MKNKDKYSEFIANKESDYIMIDGLDINAVKDWKIHPAVRNRLKSKRYIDLDKGIFNLGLMEEFEDIEIVTDLYLGTLLNNDLPEEEVVNDVFEIQMPEKFIPFSLLFNKYLPYVYWKDYLFYAFVTQHNQFVINCYGRMQPDDDDCVVYLTSK